MDQIKEEEGGIFSCTIKRSSLGSGETTVTAIRWAVLYLLNYPEVQECLQWQIDVAVPNNKRVRFDDKPKLPYIEAFVAEVLRVSNVVLLVPRSDFSSMDSVLEGYHVPKNCTILANRDSIFVDSTIFKHPERFKPDWFIDDSGKFAKKEGVNSINGGQKGSHWQIRCYSCTS